MSSEAPSPDGAGGESHDPAPQRENPGEITLSGPIDDTSVLSEHTQQIRQLLREPATTRWDDFLSILEDAVSTVRKEAKISDTTAGGKPRIPTNPNNAQQIQGLYRRNRRRAVRVIVQGETKLCEIPLDQLEEEDFAATSAVKEGNTSLLLNKARPDDVAEICLARFNSDEVAARLRRCENTAPGSDSIIYLHWKDNDPDALFLSAAFNMCLRFKQVPPAWKEMRTILIHKKGGPSEVTNWRPIALGNTISKLYVGCLAARMQQWVCDHDVLSRCQKGFLPQDGVFEHNFVLQERLDAGRAGGGDLCVAFLDFANAFGSVPQNALIDSLRGAGAGEDFCAIVADLYRDNATRIVAEAGTTAPVTISAGFRQGCPLSGLLFNLVLDPVIRTVQGGNTANDYLYGSAAAGAAGIPLAAETSDTCRVDNAFKLLTLADLEVRELAFDALTKIVSKHIRREATHEELACYLSGEMEGVFQARATQLQSVWTEARKGSRRLDITWEIFEDGGTSITCGGEDTLTSKKRRKVLKTLRYRVMRARDRYLQEEPNQGKAMECVAAYPSSSHFMRSGKFTQFCDWRFIHRARLNLLPVNGANPWTTIADKRCRVCGGEEVIIMRVTCLFENHLAALEAARSEKERKYQPIQDYLLSQFQRVSIDAIVIGMLGSWDPAND
ncbi:hypothetical protein MTO96_042872 [Rhipicephalus appendiculatus]